MKHVQHEQPHCWLYHMWKTHANLINAESWYGDKRWGGGVCQVPPASNTSAYASFLKKSSPPSVRVLESPGGLRQDFPKLHTWLPFPVRESAVHESSAVTSHWARKLCRPCQSLIDTHEKSLLLVLLTQDIIMLSCTSAKMDEVQKSLPSKKQLVVCCCFPKNGQIVYTSLNLPCNSVWQTNMPQHWQYLLFSHSWLRLLHIAPRSFLWLDESRKYVLS